MYLTTNTGVDGNIEMLHMTIYHYNQTPFGIAQICSTQVDPSFLKVLENKNTSCKRPDCEGNDSRGHPVRFGVQWEHLGEACSQYTKIALYKSMLYLKLIFLCYCFVVSLLWRQSL